MYFANKFIALVATLSIVGAAGNLQHNSDALEEYEKSGRPIAAPVKFKAVREEGLWMTAMHNSRMAQIAADKSPNDSKLQNDLTAAKEAARVAREVYQAAKDVANT